MDRHPSSYTDHPHARGENSKRKRQMSKRAGPSPRTWGEPSWLRFDRSPRRTIPTHVGRTYIVKAKNKAGADHPHARGENRARGISYVNDSGPSPRTWGEPPRAESGARAGRTIPTHVGRT